MTGRIIRLRGDDHKDVQGLLPWYVTGRLTRAEQALVEAHLSDCAECQDDARFEARLNAEVSGSPLEVDQGWALLQRRLKTRAQGRRPGVRRWFRAASWNPRRGAWLAWALAAQVVLVLASGALVLTAAQSKRYQALAAAPAYETGNIVVIFRPDTSERELRETLRASRARLVNGPTAADAYVLHVPSRERTAALADLRGSANVVLAEPVDAGAAP